MSDDLRERIARALCDLNAPRHGKVADFYEDADAVLAVLGEQDTPAPNAVCRKCGWLASVLDGDSLCGVGGTHDWDTPAPAAWACSHCGWHPDSTATWCAVGCGRDYNRMDAVASPAPEPKEG